MKYLFTTVALALGLATSAAAAPLPQVVSKNGRHALLVDGAPFLILGGQANNSSNYPAVLAASLAGHPRDARQHARDPCRLGTDRAGRRQLRFLLSRHADPAGAARTMSGWCLLWFGTWKNTVAGYTPEWVKARQQALPADDHQGRQDPLRAFAACALDARGGQARVHRADAPHSRDRPAAHCHHGPGRE